MNDPKRFKFDSNEFYIKSAEEMARLFAHAPQVVSRTMQFAERCNLKLNKIDNPFPEFAVPEGRHAWTATSRRCAARGWRSGWLRRLSTCGRAGC